MYYFRLTGGIGNQLFQYATAKAVSVRNKMPFKVYFEDQNQFDVRRYMLDDFKVALTYADAKEIPQNNLWGKVKRKLGIMNSFTEKTIFSFDPSIYEQKPDTHFVGYWQNEQYFVDIKNQLAKEIQLKQVDELTNNYQQMLARDHNSIAIHVRRGDYVRNPEATAFHGVCEMSYYKNALQQFDSLANKNYYIFSDDTAWVAQQFDFLTQKELMPFRSNAPAQDLHLMSLCKHQIIANSSFSWWAAWLNSNPNKILVAPKNWTKLHKDCAIIPKTWITI